MRKNLLLLIGIVVCLAACSSGPAVPVTYDSICQQAGKRVVIEGYLRLPGMGTTCKSGRCMLNLISDLQGRVSSVTAQVRNTAKRDSGVNAMEPLPEKFRDEDLHIHSNDGKVMPPNARLRITGDVQKSGDSCHLSVDTIEPVP